MDNSSSCIKAGLDEYQTISMETKLPNLPLTYFCLKLGGETGEVLEKVGKIIRDKDGQMTPEDKHGLSKELGDVLWYVAAIADELGYSLGDIALQNRQKLLDRQSRGVLGGSGDNR